MKSKLIMVKVVFSYFVQYFKKGDTDPYRSYSENYTKTKAFDDNIQYSEILERCRYDIERDFDKSSTDIDHESKEEFECEITYDISRLVSYEILAEED